MTTTDTIVARATPGGRGGVAIVRISGPLVRHIMQVILGGDLKPREACYKKFLDQQGEMIDEGIALFFPEPNSFTGEDVLELQGHGGTIVVDLIIQSAVAGGARIASPGEFSLRAFLNGKIDLTQAEALADLIDASSKQAARSALYSLQGGFSQAINQLKERMIETRIHIEAAIDFSDEDIDLISENNLLAAIKQIGIDLNRLEKQAKQGSVLREGIKVVIVGKPNVGKSSLLNRLAGKDIAIVTDIPGTTRDIIRDDIIIDGIPLHIIDTAGLRESDDIVELEGIKRAHQAMTMADIILHMSDHDEIENEINDDESLPNVQGKDCIYIRNKIDLQDEAPSIKNNIIALSAKTGAGIDLLLQTIKEKLGLAFEHESVFLARRRHLDAIAKVKSHLQTSHSNLRDGTFELAAEELRLAQRFLNEITGEFTADDLLGHIFSSFCIGK